MCLNLKTESKRARRFGAAFALMTFGTLQFFYALHFFSTDKGIAASILFLSLGHFLGAYAVFTEETRNG